MRQVLTCMLTMKRDCAIEHCETKRKPLINYSDACKHIVILRQPRIQPNYCEIKNCELATSLNMQW